ncbi:hypothetical protein Tco_0884694 [Tanacetum coccineum]
MEYLVNISKRRAFWSLKENILKINDSDYQYAVSIKEDTTYPCLHSPKATKETSSIRRIQKRAIRHIEDIVCEDSGRYQAWSLLHETPIRHIQPIGYADQLFLLTHSMGREPHLMILVNRDNWSYENCGYAVSRIRGKESNKKKNGMYRGIAKDAKLIEIDDQLLVLIKRQVETELMLKEKLRDLCEEVSNFVKEIKDVVKEVKQLSGKDVAKETVHLFRRGQKRDLYKMTRLQMMVNESHLSVYEKHNFVSKMNFGTLD